MAKAKATADQLARIRADFRGLGAELATDNEVRAAIAALREVLLERQQRRASERYAKQQAKG